MPPYASCHTPRGVQVEQFKKQAGLDDKFLIFWNSRNARRKMSGSLIFWFKDFLDEVGHRELGLINGEVIFSVKKTPPQELNLLYNAADVTCGISDAEGFGLSTFESLSAETPIIVTMTGGLQELGCYAKDV